MAKGLLPLWLILSLCGIDTYWYPFPNHALVLDLFSFCSAHMGCCDGARSAFCGAGASDFHRSWGRIIHSPAMTKRVPFGYRLGTVWFWPITTTAGHHQPSHAGATSWCWEVMWGLSWSPWQIHHGCLWYAIHTYIIINIIINIIWCISENISLGRPHFPMGKNAPFMFYSSGWISLFTNVTSIAKQMVAPILINLYSPSTSQKQTI